jgi:tripartite ATP-independent transporter DctM subunit
MSEVMIGVIGLCVLLVLFLTGIELGYAMFIIGFVGFCIIKTFAAGFNLLAKDVFDVFASYSFTVVPLFLLMGQAAFNAGIASKLYDTSHKFIGHVPGGLAMATVAGATIFKSICGSSTATAATFASVAVPEMDRFGYDKKLSTGIVATVGTLGVILPPSSVLIIFGVITQQSIGRLFLAGIVPGLIIALLFAVIIYGWCKINPKVGPKGPRFGWSERMKSLPEVIWPLLIFVVVIGGLLKGFFTPTEAGSVGTAAVLVLCFAKRTLGWKGFVQSVSESLRSACMVIVLIAGSSVLGHFLAVTKIPMITADWLVALPLHPYLIMLLIAIVYLVGGSFIDDMAFLVLATPIFFPAVQQLGFDPLWFGIIIGITVMIGVVLPPVAINVFIVKNITKQPFSVIYAGVYPFLLALVGCGVVLFIFPRLATFIPNILMPG